MKWAVLFSTAKKIMAKTKIKQRIENALDDFLADESLKENDSMIFANDSQILRNELTADFSKKAIDFVQIFKRVLFFLPGSFVLFVISMGLTLVSVHSPRFMMINKLEPERLLVIFLFFSASVCMTWFGLGDWRKQKHFVIPASIVVLGIFVGVIGGVSSALSSQIERFIYRGDNFPVYLFPLALIVPILAKGWIDRKQEDM